MYFKMLTIIVSHDHERYKVDVNVSQNNYWNEARTGEFNVFHYIIYTYLLN